ncbi:E3 ubiquitin-protein ligase RBBP6 [Sarcoptes scabiei]|nr:E3 ubiquitin-protein ligase RBBP6 [Sarcoptes scabiei]
MITANGEYAVPLIDHVAYKEIKKEKPPFAENENEAESEPKIEIPSDLQCTLCKNLLQDAVLIPCCGNSFCDECKFRSNFKLFNFFSILVPTHKQIILIIIIDSF